MKKFLLILLVIVILLLANTSYAAEVSQENGKVILTLRGPDMVRLKPGEEVTKRYAITLTSTGKSIYEDVISRELSIHQPAWLPPFSSETIYGYYTFTEADEGETWVSAEFGSLFVELMVTVEVVRPQEVEPAEYPLFMFSARFFELMEQFGFDEAVLRWNEEYGR